MKPLSGLPEKKNAGERVIIDPIDSMMGKSARKKKRQSKPKKMYNKKEIC